MYHSSKLGTHSSKLPIKEFRGFLILLSKLLQDLQARVVLDFRKPLNNNAAKKKEHKDKLPQKEPNHLQLLVEGILFLANSHRPNQLLL
jgi:hypothetical protein